MALATRINRGSVDPFESIGLDSFVRQVFAPEASPATAYGVDVYEDAEHLYIDAELPGFNRDQLDVTINDGVLTIIAERSAPTPSVALAAPSSEGAEKGESSNNEQQQSGLIWHVRECRAARMRRSFSLPKNVDGSTVEAKLSDGVLHLTLGKRPESKPRKITIA
jgi:HSP20 family protein